LSPSQSVPSLASAENPAASISPATSPVVDSAIAGSPHSPQSTTLNPATPTGTSPAAPSLEDVQSNHRSNSTEERHIENSEPVQTVADEVVVKAAPFCPEQSRYAHVHKGEIHVLL